MKKIVPKVPFQGNRFAARQPEQTVDGNDPATKWVHRVLPTPPRARAAHSTSLTVETAWPRSAATKC